jgi:hypothetical protein
MTFLPPSVPKHTHTRFHDYKLQLAIQQGSDIYFHSEFPTVLPRPKMFPKTNLYWNISVHFSTLINTGRKWRTHKFTSFLKEAMRTISNDMPFLVAETFLLASSPLVCLATPRYKSMDTSTYDTSRENRLAKSITYKLCRAQNNESTVQTEQEISILFPSFSSFKAVYIYIF